MKTAQLLIIVLIFSPLLSFAATLHVPQDFPTVQAAVAASVAGDTILVSPGLYVIPGVPSTILPGTVGLELHDGTTLAGSGPAQTVLEFAGADAGIVPLGTATVKLLHLRKATTAIYAYVGSNITVTNVIITELTGTNVFGIELNQGSSYTIHNNTIDNIHQTNDPVGTAIDVPFGGVSDIQNNLLTSNTHGVTAGSFSGGTYTYNDVFGSTSADWSTCDANGCSAVSAPASNISADPLYCPDFSLQTASPARNAGNPAILNPDGTRSDLGAYGGPAAILPPTTCGGTGQPAVSVSPTQIPFPPTPLNTTSVPVTVTVSNPGTATLSISDISTQDPFKILNFSSNVVTGIAPNTSGTFDATFSPKVQGTMFSSVMISSNATSSPTLSIPLSGTGSPSGKRVFVSWTAGQVLQFILLKETNTTSNTQVQFEIANLQPAWYEVQLTTVGQIRGSLPTSFVLGPAEIKSDFSTITFSPGAALRFTADRTTNHALQEVALDFFWRVISGNPFPVTESDRAMTLLGAQDKAATMLLQIGRDIANDNIVDLISDALGAIGNQQVLNVFRALGLAVGTKASLIASIVSNSAQALSILVLELLSPPSEDLFVTAQR